VLSAVSALSFFGVTLGVSLVLFCLSILGGFEVDLQRKIIGADAHILLEGRDGAALNANTFDPGAFESITPVVAWSPLLRSEVAVASSSNYKGAVVFGVNPKRASEVLDVFAHISEGDAKALSDEEAGTPTDVVEGVYADIPSVIIGREMARSLHVRVGERIRLIAPNLESLTPLRPAPKSLGFRVAGVFSTKMYDYDANYIYVSLRTARRFFERDAGTFDGVHVRLRTPEVAAQAGRTLEKTFPKARALTWEHRNKTLVAALRLERVIAFFVLAFVIMVASFSVVSTITMSVIEKKKEIAMLKAMGAYDQDIMRVFVSQGLVVGGIGAALGAALGVVAIQLAAHIGVWIPQDVYYIDALPVSLNGWDVLLVVVAALLIVWDFSVYPALKGAALVPVDGLRD